MKFSLNVHWYIQICFAKIYSNIHSIRLLKIFKDVLGDLASRDLKIAS